jgi:hypothetical protein
VKNVEGIDWVDIVETLYFKDRDAMPVRIRRSLDEDLEAGGRSPVIFSDTIEFLAKNGLADNGDRRQIIALLDAGYSRTLHSGRDYLRALITA